MLFYLFSAHFGMFLVNFAHFFRTFYKFQDSSWNINYIHALNLKAITIIFEIFSGQMCPLTPPRVITLSVTVASYEIRIPCVKDYSFLYLAMYKYQNINVLSPNFSVSKQSDKLRISNCMLLRKYIWQLLASYKCLAKYTFLPSQKWHSEYSIAYKVN